MSIIATTHHESRLYRHRHSHDHVILTIIMLRGLIVSVVILSLALAFFSLVHTVILLISTAPPPGQSILTPHSTVTSREPEENTNPDTAHLASDSEPMSLRKSGLNSLPWQLFSRTMVFYKGPRIVGCLVLSELQRKLASHSLGSTAWTPTPGPSML